MAVLSPAAGASPACTDTFTGPNLGDWGTAGNWTTAGSAHSVPTSADVACWDAGTTVVLSTGTEHADSVQGGSLQITGGGLTVASTTNASNLANCRWMARAR